MRSFVLEFGLYRHVLTPLFPKSVSPTCTPWCALRAVRRGSFSAARGAARQSAGFSHDEHRIFP
jgi:hypothetical protein